MHQLSPRQRKILKRICRGRFSPERLNDQEFEICRFLAVQGYISFYCGSRLEDGKFMDDLKVTPTEAGMAYVYSERLPFTRITLLDVTGWVLAVSGVVVDIAALLV